MQDHYWQSFTFSLQTQEDYQYLTVGNFRHDNQTIISNHGKDGVCYFTDPIVVVPADNGVIMDIPSVFIPDQDGLNDFFCSR